MRRRDFIGLVGGAALAAPLGARAQEAGRTYRVAMVMPVGREEPAPLAFIDELRKEGFIEGRNLVILGGTAIRNDQADAVTAGILQAAPDAIVTGGDLFASTFQRATQSVPIFVMTEDLITGGFVTSLARPNANITGISLISGELDGKRQDILIEAVPQAQRLAALADTNVASLSHLKGLEASARNLGRELLIARATRDSEIISAMNEVGLQGAAGLNVLSSPMLHYHRHAIMKRAAELRLPAIYQWPETVEEGGLLGYGPSFIDVFRQRARMTIKALRGIKVAEIPVEQPSTFQLVINLKTAKALDYQVPVGLELRANRLIE